MIHVWIPGEPKGQPRPRAFSRGGQARVYDPGTAEGWKGLVAAALRPVVLEMAEFRSPYFGGDPVAVEMGFKMPRPAGMRRKREHPEDGEVPHVKKPDVDNLAKAILDACTQLRIWHDDSQVAELRVRKVYHRDKGGVPGLELTIQPLADVPQAETRRKLSFSDSD